MYFLKANGSDDDRIAFQNAYAALAIDPNGAYIMNKLALLYLENNRTDSAVYYATKASKIAPKWTCALTTLALAQKVQLNKTEDRLRYQKRKSSKLNLGLMLGGGISMPKVTYSKEEWRQPNVDYNDSLNSIGTR